MNEPNKKIKDEQLQRAEKKTTACMIYHIDVKQSQAQSKIKLTTCWQAISATDNIL